MPGAVTMQDNPVPSRISAAVFLTKSFLLKARRSLQNAGAGLKRWPAGDRNGYPVLLAELRTPLWSETSAAERVLQQGKVQNLRCAVRRLRGITIPANATFSFWKQIGRAGRRRGYVAGRQVQEGCIIPAIGGGLCQLSNALYELALRTDCTIVERHPHTRIVPGSAAAQGRDATVFWNYLDLQFRPSQPVLLDAHLTPDALIVRLYGQSEVRRTAWQKPQAASIPLQSAGNGHSCLSCGIEVCFRHRLPALTLEHNRSGERTAYLLDEWSAEFALWIAGVHNADDTLALPIKGKLWNVPRYAWNTAGFSVVGTATRQTLLRSFASRRLAQQGAERQTAQMQGAENLALHLAKFLTPDCERVCVAQNLLPFLWREGHLGGRRFTVLLARQPMAVLQNNLNYAALLHPESTTLSDFRAPDWLVEAETEALEAAESLVTPHTYLASLYPHKTRLLPWSLPEANRISGGLTGASVVFPGPTVGRKGAYELREAARRLDLEIVLMNKNLEDPDFWDGVRVRTLPEGEDAMANAAVVVQSAFVEDRPRVLLRAIAFGLPVIATERCGLGQLPGVEIVPCGDADALTAAISRTLARKSAEIPLHFQHDMV